MHNNDEEVPDTNDNDDSIGDNIKEGVEEVKETLTGEDDNDDDLVAGDDETTDTNDNRIA